MGGGGRWEKRDEKKEEGGKAVTVARTEGDI